MWNSVGVVEQAGVSETSYGIFVTYWFYIVSSLAVTLAWMHIYWRAGYSRWVGLLFLIPGVNVLMMFHLAWARWPVQHQLDSAVTLAGAATDAEIYRFLSQASRLEHRGRWDEAMRRYEAVAERYAGRAPGEDAKNYAETLRQKMPQK